MNVKELIRRLASWRGDITVVIERDDHTWVSISRVDWEETNAGPVILIRPVRKVGEAQ